MNEARAYVESMGAQLGDSLVRRGRPSPAMAEVIVSAMTTVALANVRDGWTREQAAECSGRIMSWLMDRYGLVAVAGLVSQATRQVEAYINDRREQGVA